MATYANELGKCYAKSESGFYRLYKVDGLWSIYLVSEDESGRLAAAFGGYITDPENFEYGVAALREELLSLAADAGF